MDARRTATSVPKRALIDAILKAIPEGTTRAGLRIADQTSLRQRLDDFSKTELLAFLVGSPEGEKALKEAERNYPLSAPPTLYLVKVQRRPNSDVLAARASELARVGRDAGCTFGGTSAVRAVYVGSTDQAPDFNDSVTEIPLLYERRIEYTVCEPDSEDYGERIALYSLERAFVWIVEGKSHAVVCGSHFPAVRPILEFGREWLDLVWALPDLTEEMLNQLAADGAPRSATFSALDIDLGGSFDVRTVTISDPLLGERRSFQQVKEDEYRQQTAGFYANYPNLAFGGLGIARRYGRIWTPAHVSRKTLAALATGLVERTEQELSGEYERNLPGYVHYYRNLAVEIDGHQLRGQMRDAFDQLAIAVLQAARAPGGESSLSASLLHNLACYQRQLRLTVVSEFECPECGLVLGECPACRTPYAARADGPMMVLECPNEKCKRRLALHEGYECECGEVIPVGAVLNHVRMLPEPGLLDAFRQFLDAMDDVTWKGFFVVSGQILRVLPLRAPAPRELVRLGDLQLWRVRARHHLRGVPTESRRDTLTAVLRATKEKCKKNNGHPTREICDECLATPVMAEQVKVGNLCLPRMLGLAIGEGFDGVHHGYEVADVRYEDTLAETSQHIKVGIHLKSRTRSAPQGLGRSRGPIKALYTQLFYSAYLSLIGSVSFNVVGISVPNAIRQDVLDSMRRLAAELGFSFLAVDETDWLKIADAVLEQLEIDQPAEEKTGQVP
jgi:hypothetical protein